ncbi:MAG: MBL fold metallo-hydrolase [Patescibacteria group bacterium]
MIITYHGFGFVKLQVGEKIVAINPVGKDADFKPARFGAHLALISVNDSYYNGVENVTLAGKEPFVVSGPGEYEVDDVFIRGIETKGPVGEINTIYSIMIDQTKILHLGAITESEVSPEAVEAIGEVDILFVPVDSRIIDPKLASKLAFSFNPKIVIPVNHSVDEPKNSLSMFLKESGAESVKPVDKLVLKKKDILEKEGEVVIIKSF